MADMNAVERMAGQGQAPMGEAQAPSQPQPDANSAVSSIVESLNGVMALLQAETQKGNPGAATAMEHFKALVQSLQNMSGQAQAAPEEVAPIETPQGEASPGGAVPMGSAGAIPQGRKPMGMAGRAQVI
jgi:hypothetical protein